MPCSETFTARSTPTFACQFQAVFGDVGDHHVARARVFGDRRGHDADRARAGDHHVLAERRERQRRVHRVAERVEDRGHVQVHVDAVHPHVLLRHAHELRERAVEVHPEPAGVRAQVAATRLAVAAVAADEVALRADEVADLRRGDLPADLDDLADELVAEHQRRGDVRPRPRVPRVDVQIRAADAGAQHADDHVERAGRRVGDVGERQARRCVELGECLHVVKSAAGRT
jgi:hypothetical protein